IGFEHVIDQGPDLCSFPHPEHLDLGGRLHTSSLRGYGPGEQQPGRKRNAHENVILRGTANQKQVKRQKAKVRRQRTFCTASSFCAGSQRLVWEQMLWAETPLPFA